MTEPSAYVETAKRYGIPIGVALATMLVYQLLIAPIVSDIWQDWTFLHLARQQTIQQIQQQQGKKP